MMEIKGAVILVGSIASLGAGSWVGGVKAVDFLDSRYAPLAAVEDLAYSQLKKDLRDLRDRIAEAQNPEVKKGLEEDLESLLDRLCRSYPEDRECKK